MNQPLERIPTFEDREEMWRVMYFTPLRIELPRTAEYLKALSGRLSSGPVLCHSFEPKSDPLFERYLESTDLYGCNFFERFWKAPGPLQAIPFRPFDLNYFERGLFWTCPPLCLAGFMANYLYQGGLCPLTYKGYAREAKRLAEAAAEELLGGDFENELCYICEENWSPFFLDHGCDRTIVVVSKTRRLIHAILVTDVD